nr:MAG: CsbD family protein [Chloroflexota bacterium]
MAGEWDILKGMWNQIKGDARNEWGKLTDDDWERIAGNRDKLVGRLQEHYGWNRMEAERKVDEWAGRHGR